MKDIFNFAISGKSKKRRGVEKQLYLNHEELLNLNIITNDLHSETYKTLRKIKLPQYDYAWLMRNKKGFNTAYFIINFDVIICDKFGNIIALQSNVAPGHVSKYYENGFSIYFMTVGSIKFYNLKKSSRLTLKYEKSTFELFADAVGI